MVALHAVTVRGAAPTSPHQPGVCPACKGHGHPLAQGGPAIAHGACLTCAPDAEQEQEPVIPLRCSHPMLPGRTGGGDLSRDKPQSVQQQMNSRSELLAHTSTGAIKPPANYDHYCCSGPDDPAAFCTPPLPRTARDSPTRGHGHRRPSAPLHHPSRRQTTPSPPTPPPRPCTGLFPQPCWPLPKAALPFTRSDYCFPWRGLSLIR